MSLAVRLIVISVVSTTICCALGYDFSTQRDRNTNRNLKYSREPRIDVVGSEHNVETSGWKAMYPSRVPEPSNEEEVIYKTKEPKVKNVAPYSNSRNTDGAIYDSGIHKTYNNENLDRRLFTTDNTNSENKSYNASNKSNVEPPNVYISDGYEPSNPEVLVVMPSRQFQTEVPSTNHAYSTKDDDTTTQKSSDRQIILEDIEQSNSYGDKIHPADSFRVPRRIHPYSTASSMYLAQENLFVAPRAFQVDQLPSTPQLNAIMNRAMAKVKVMLRELEDDKGSIKPLPKKATRNVTMAALLIEEVTRSLANEYSIRRGEVTSRVEVVPIKDTMLSEMCPDVEASFCFPQKYRNPNGECNNVKHPMWGVTGAAYLRLHEPQYEDGVRTPRNMARSGRAKLPDALTVSSKLIWTRNNPHEHLTALAAIWGQFVSHDISYTLPLSGYEKCCDSMFRKENAMECHPIVQNVNEEICQEYVRSAIGLKPGCVLGPREQMNFATAFLDGSGIYGSTPKSSEDLRLLKGGRLRMDPNDDRLLPLDEHNPNCNEQNVDNSKDTKTRKGQCLRSGDERVNHNSGLAALHTLMTREHNRVASLLEEVNKHWDEETLYQEARRVVSAEIQHITYHEFLPVLLGEVLTNTFGLALPKTNGFSGYHLEYNDELPAATLNSVGNAILPFLLSLLPPKVTYYDSTGHWRAEVPFNSTYWAPFDAHDPTFVQEILLGLTRTPAEKADLAMAENTKIYKNQDQLATIIHRGRDHGLPTYTQVRESCGLLPVSTFEELNNTVDTKTIEALQRTYQHVEDIDLFIGGLAERPLSGAVVGPTFGCLLGQQFQILKKGDRFWYENNIPPSALSKDQLQEIRKVTLASIICANMESIYSVQPEAFISNDPYLNSPVLCDVFPQLNMELWKTDTPALQVPEAILIQTLEKGTLGLAQRRKEEYRLWENNMGARSKSAVGTAYAFSRPKREALLLSNTSLLLEYTSRVFLNSLQEPGNTRIKRQINGGNRLNVNIDDFADGLTNIDVTRVVSTVQGDPQSRDSGSICQDADENLSPCDHTSKYRTYNGWCNNLNNPQYGKSTVPQIRFLSAKYDDAISRPRFRSLSGQALPSPRLVSIVVHADVSYLHGRYTLMLMQFGQFLDHDISLTPINKGFPDSILDCRACDSSQTVHPECWPIPVPKNDPYFPALNTSSGRAHCIAFTRSLPGQQRLGPREQVNQNTAFIDGSNIYGNDKCDSMDLRELIGGRLNTTLPHHGRGKHLLPKTKDNLECKAQSGFCFKGGDSRASEQPALAATHTIFLREHNRLVQKLKRVNPHWNDETLYHEGRRIMAAINQHITYNEFLPRIIGWNYMNLYNLRVATEGYTNEYDATCNPGIFNEFATAAFRFGHSLIRPMLTRMAPNWREMPRHIRLRDGFFNPDMLYETAMIDEVMRGLVSTPMENQDQFLSGEITNHLFEEKRIPFSGLDLAALNIQRGRDHGLRPYNEYRIACNLKKAHDFSDLSVEISSDVIKRLRQVYQSVDDIDLFTGGLSETPLQGALVGPTFACIIGIQFQKLKKCDRHWYENDAASTRFSEAQLNEIRKLTLSKVVCENCDIVGDIQKSIFDQPHEFLNPRVPCRSLPDIDVSHWREEVTQCRVNGLDISLGSSRKISPCTSCTCTKEGAQCQSLKINNCRQLIEEFGDEAVRRDNICKTQCSFALNSLGNTGHHPDDILITLDTSDTLQAPGSFSHRPDSSPTTLPSGIRRPLKTRPINGNDLQSNRPLNNGFHRGRRPTSSARRPGFPPGPPLPPRVPLRPTSKLPVQGNFPNNPTTATKDNIPGHKEPLAGDNNNGLGAGPNPNGLGTGPNGLGNRPNSVQSQLQQQAAQTNLGPNLRPPARKPSRGFGFFPSLPNLAELFGL